MRTNIIGLSCHQVRINDARLQTRSVLIILLSSAEFNCLIVFIADFFPWHRTSSVPICAPNFVLSIWTKIGFWTWKSLFPAGNQNSRFSSTISVNQSERDIFYIVVDKAIKKTMAVLETDEQNRNWSSFGGKLCFVAFSQWTVVVTCTTWHTVECKVIVPNGYRLERSF